MPTSVPVITHATGDVFPASDWNTYVKNNVDKLLNTGHRVLTVAQFAALTTPEGTKGSVAPDEVYLEVDATNGILWHLAYESGETTYKWRFLGGPPMVSEVATSETTASTTYAGLATAGPSVALPRAGDYDVEVGSGAGSLSVSAQVWMSYDIGGTGAVDADAKTELGGTASIGSGMRAKRKAGLATSTLTAKYRTSTGTAGWGNRFMRVWPVRIRHDA